MDITKLLGGLYTESDKEKKWQPIVQVPGDALVDLDLFRNSEGDLAFQRILIGTVPINPDSMQIQGGYEFDEHVPAVATDASITYTEGRKVLQIYCDQDNDAGVADRVLTITITKQIAGASLIATTITGTLTLSANQNGAIFMPEGTTETFLNDNGTVSTESTNICPIYMQEGDVISASSTNKQAGDQIRLQVVSTRTGE